jgi:hypothetical protein
LPTIQLIDALLVADKKTVLLFASSKGAREAFGKLFFETFSIPLDRSNPLQCGLRADIGTAGKSALADLEPVRWPRAKDEEPAPARRQTARAVEVPVDQVAVDEVAVDEVAVDGGDA